MKNDIHLGLAFVLVGIAILALAIIMSGTDIFLTDKVLSTEYEGRIYFDNLAEYQEFKEYLATNPDIKIVELEVLSSSDPLVDFKLTVNSDKFVPYGAATSRRYQYNELTIMIAIVAFVAPFVLGFYLLGRDLWGGGGSK